MQSTGLGTTQGAQTRQGSCFQGVYSRVGEMAKYTANSNIGLAVTNAINESIKETAINFAQRIQGGFTEMNGE